MLCYTIYISYNTLILLCYRSSNGKEEWRYRSNTAMGPRPMYGHFPPPPPRKVTAGAKECTLRPPSTSLTRETGESVISEEIMNGDLSES